MHLESGDDKYELLVLMLRKLYGFVKGDVAADNPDSPMNQELLLAGHFYTMFVKEKIAEMLLGVETLMKRCVAWRGAARWCGVLDAVSPVAPSSR